MKKKKNFVLDNSKSVLLKILVSISMFFLIIICSNYDIKIGHYLVWILISSFIGSILLFLLLLKSKKQININKKLLMLSFFISTYSMGYLLNLKYSNFKSMLSVYKISSFADLMIFIIGILGILALMFLSYFFLEKIFPKVKKFLKNLDETEKKIFNFSWNC